MYVYVYVYITRICNFLDRGTKYNPDSYRCQTKKTDSVGDEIAGSGNARLLANWRQQVMRTIEAAHFQILENLEIANELMYELTIAIVNISKRKFRETTRAGRVPLTWKEKMRTRRC